MDYSSMFLFFFGAIGVFNSFLVSLYFIFYKKPRQISSTLLGWFLLFFSERALRSLIYFFSDITPNSYSKFGPITFLFIGPFLLLYIISVIKPNSKALVFWKYHILFWIVTAIFMHFIYPFRTDPIFYKKYILKGINIQWLAYVLISGYYVFNHLKNTHVKNKKLEARDRWLLSLLIAVLILWLIYFFISFDYFVIGSITFSIIFYSFFIYFMFNKKERAQVFDIGTKYGTKKIEAVKLTQLTEKLSILMLEHKPYKNPNLKLTDVAKELGISTHQFSQLLNDNLKKSFSTFINEYRIEEAKQIIKSNTKYTLDAIGNESGFNSKSTFYNSFKQVVGMTPSKYREQFLSS
ncbi:AraC family transcriptional regulator [Aquimarina sp. 2201CG5-10]|uniref:AraC family transcriptional regulator n=1 Tax=Aquimarina callyspongiae TaxID=3098150 RepID=UPI002AB43E93|nr:helix-turn-helix domain-containing protein [Aquimarina sp. 2201CG5-10]MDY8135958.1 helix-turn-helix domain-containing protein [Aquimarina sp. 2201CG5-10]